MSTEEKKRKRALLVFEVVIFSYLIGMFILQMYMYSQRDW